MQACMCMSKGKDKGKLEDNEGCLCPYIQLTLGVNCIPIVALMDTSANLNFTYYETWQQIGKPSLSPIALQIGELTKDYSTTLGLCKLEVIINYLNCLHKLYLM